MGTKKTVKINFYPQCTTGFFQPWHYSGNSVMRDCPVQRMMSTCIPGLLPTDISTNLQLGQPKMSPDIVTSSWRTTGMQ